MTETQSTFASTVDPLDRSVLLALLHAGRAVNDVLEPDRACRLVVHHAAEVLDAEEASVLLLDESRSELVFQTVLDPANSTLMKGHRFPADQGIAGQVVRTRRSVLVSDVRQNRNFYAGIDEITHRKTRDLMAVPLVYRERVLGVLEVINRRSGRSFERRDLQLLEVFANLVAPAAHHAQTFDLLSRANRGLRESMPTAQFIGNSPRFQQALSLCRKVAPTGHTVLLEGETGTGKEMAARAIHALSLRAEKAFVAVNCAALPETLVESELFGHEAGAFTGAAGRRIGLFELADGGTLLLDEIGELNPSMQAKLLRVLETRSFSRLGGEEVIHCDVRVIAATNRNLREESTKGSFREDLFYRLSVFPIVLPPLRDRIDDIRLLVEHFMAQVGPSLGITSPPVSDDALDCLSEYSWPGNIRELRNVIERAAILAEGEIRPEHLPPDVIAARRAQAEPSPAPRSQSALKEQEYRLVVQALEKSNWNQSAAARELGISRDILRYRMKQFGLSRPER